MRTVSDGGRPRAGLAPCGATRVAPAIEVDSLHKSYGALPVLRGLSFTALPGRVTGLLGPNGAGKSTAFRCILGLAPSDSGRAHIGGVPYHTLEEPLQTVGASIDPRTMDPLMSGRAHLLIYAAYAGVGEDRVEELITTWDMGAYARRRIGTYSTGMRQRLSIAASLLGDPEVLILDEPTNGLDPQGVAFLRAALRSWAEEGRTVLLASHLLRELTDLVDDVIILAKGRAIADGPADDLLRRHGARNLEELFLTTIAEEEAA